MFLDGYFPDAYFPIAHFIKTGLPLDHPVVAGARLPALEREACLDKLGVSGILRRMEMSFILESLNNAGTLKPLQREAE